MGRGKNESRFRLSPRVGSVNSCMVSWVASQDGFMRELRATISGGKDKNFPEKVIDLGFFRLLKFSPRAT